MMMQRPWLNFDWRYLGARTWQHWNLLEHWGAPCLRPSFHAARDHTTISRTYIEHRNFFLRLSNTKRLVAVGECPPPLGGATGDGYRFLCPMSSRQPVLAEREG